MSTALKLYISAIAGTLLFVFSALSQEANDDVKTQIENVSKMCRGEFAGIFAENINEVTINGRRISVEHSKNGIQIREADGALIDGVKYGSAMEYVECLERMIKALGLKAGLTALDFPAILAEDVPCDSRRVYDTDYWTDEPIVRLFSDFAKNDGKIVFVDFYTWIGGGCDYEDSHEEDPLNQNRTLYGVSEEPQEFVEFSDDELLFIYNFNFYGIHNQGDEEPNADRIEREKLLAICDSSTWSCPTTALIAFPSTGSLILTFHPRRTLGLKGLVRVSVYYSMGQMAIHLNPIDVTDRLLLAYEQLANQK